jgi:PAS domain S-box-containing protein
MKLSENSNHNKITEIKKDILNLQRELDDLYNEHNRLSQEILAQEVPIPYKTYADPLEDALRKSELRYRQLVELAHCILIRWDINGTILYANNYAHAFLGYNPDELIGSDVRRLIPDTEANGRDLRYLIDHIIAEPSQYLQFENENITKTGERVWVSWGNRAITDDDGTFLEMLAVGHDISRIKKSEEKLARERELFEGIFNSIPVMITIYDPQLQNFRFNKEFIKLTGWTEADAMDGSLMEKLYPEPGYRQMASDYMTSLQSGWKDFVMSARDGSQVDSSWANILLKSGIQIGIGIDIREKIRTEATLKENEQRIRAMFNNAAVGIVEVDSEDRFVHVNNRICDMLGYSEHELLGKYVSEITAPEDRIESISAIEQIHHGNIERYHYEKRYLQSNGSPVWVHVTVSGVYNSDGKHISTIRTIEDISERKKFENALIESEARFRLLADNISQMAWISDHTGKTIWFNKRWFDFTGMSLEDMQNGGHALVNHPDHVERTYTNYLKAIQSGTRWEETYMMRGKTGEYKWFLSRMVPVFDDKGNITLWFGTSTDIDEQVKNEETIRKNEQRLNAIFNNAAIGIVELDVDTRFIMVNDRVCEILEYTREELLNKTVLDVTAPGDREQTRKLHDSLLRGDTSILNYEKRYTKKDGASIWVHISMSAIRDVNGIYIRSIGTVQNIEERKNTELKLNQALKEAEEGRNILDALMKYAPLGITIADAPDVSVRMISRYGEELTGTRREDFLGMPAEEHPERWRVYHMDGTTPAKPEELPLTRAIWNGEIIRNEEWYIYKHNDTLIPLLCEAAPIRDNDGKITGAVMGWQDITERKQAEQELKQKNEELTRFIYTVSHDLKSPLVTIKSFTSFLQEDIAAGDTEAQSRDVSFIQNAVDRMGKLLDELLELSRIGRKEIPKRQESMKEIVQAALEMVAGRLMQKNIEVVYSGPSVMLFGHSQRLLQLYQNLLDNAAKFMGSQPQPKIEIGAYMDKEKGIVMFVKDNGSGIDPQYHHKLFGLFEKLDNSTEGTGIGLALIKRIVEVHGGTIWFHSEGVNKGTTFYFTLEKTQIIGDDGPKRASTR